MDLPDYVIEALSHGNKIEAIKRLRQARHMGLAEAKAAVESWQGSGSAARCSSPAQVRPQTLQLPEDVVAALHSGNKIEAIKRLRLAQPLGLKDARDTVEAWLAEQPDIAATPGKAARSASRASLLLTLAVIATFTWMFVHLVDVAAAIIVLSHHDGYQQTTFSVEALHYQTDDESGLRWGFEGHIAGRSERFYAPTLADADALGYAGLRRRFPPGAQLAVWYNPHVTRTLFQGRSLHVLPFTESLAANEIARLQWWAVYCLLPFVLVLGIAARRQKRHQPPDAENGRPLVP
jgi:ribosomal protein L7/L12